jgi:peptidyl-tRNA hydrolase, PTH1 family
MDPSMIRLCAFLGNVGTEYARNRHNVAWLFLESLQEAQGLSWSRKFKGSYAQADFNGNRVVLVKPETFMNLSGESVREFARFYGIAPEEILVVHDELELPFGYLSFKRAGGLGGHNGLRSMVSCLGTPDFLRFRFGIGRPDHADIAGYVLSDFNPEERGKLSDAVFIEAGRAFSKCMKEGFESVEGEYRKFNTLGS